MVHTEYNDYILAVKADDADEAEDLAKEWFFANISSLDNSDIHWIVELCDNDELIEVAENEG